jgi:two-component system response regulator EvgA
MNAIIIDDHPLARIAIRNLLDTNGITVAAELDSGAHAVQTAESMQPDLLIVDVDIPELSGIDVLEQLRKRRYREKLSSFPRRMNCSTANAAPTAGPMVL